MLKQLSLNLKGEGLSADYSILGGDASNNRIEEEDRPEAELVISECH